MMDKIEIGCECHYNGEKWLLKKFVTPSKVIIEKEGVVKAVKKERIEVLPTEKNNLYLDEISDKEWKEAQRRYSILSELNSYLEQNEVMSTKEAISSIANNYKISERTLYRWKKTFDNSGLISSLVPGKSSGGRGKGRINAEIERLILDVINDYHFHSQKPRVSKSYRELRKRCKKLNVSPPSEGTFRSRIDLITKKEVLSRRSGKSLINHITDPVPGSYPEVRSPMEVVQIDHTKLDIIVVDENRNPIGRPWITLGIDLYSRMATGFYISFDTPGTLGTGICISNSILPKDQILAKYSIKSDWPIQGRIINLHSDNAPEFKSRTLRMACQEYGINLLYRAKGKTHWGGHIERLLGNFLGEIHLIPGTTFSNPKERNEYNSEKNAVLTLSELEEWLHTFILDVYHQQHHSALGMSPIMKYYEGVYNNSELPAGLGSFEYDPFKVKVDFLPSFERTVQRTGVVIDHIRYYGDVLSQYIYSSRTTNNLHFPKLRKKEKFLFKRDPRDLSCIFFFDPNQKEYLPIFYANKSRPSISIWEHRSALKELKKKGEISDVTENSIFEALEKMDRLIEDAKKSKRKAKLKSSKNKSKGFLDKKETIQENEYSISDEKIDFDSIEPFTYDSKNED